MAPVSSGCDECSIKIWGLDEKGKNNKRDYFKLS